MGRMQKEPGNPGTEIDGIRSTGRIGEDEACRYLQSVGHTILERNWRSSHLEVDIISCDPQGIHFTEVKTRREPVMAAPEFNVGRAKQRNLVRAAGAFLRSHPWRAIPFCGDEVFFDVISIVIDPDGKCSLEYFPQAFIPMYR